VRLTTGEAHGAKRRWLRSAGIVMLATAVLAIAAASANLIMEWREKSTTTPYGNRVPVAGGALNVWTNGRPGPTIVLVGGLGTAAPGLDFAPLARQLRDYHVVVVEGFGYGYSGMTAPPRTLDNITRELHDVLSQLKVTKPYILAGHSIGGYYTLAYTNRYPTEVSAVIGIDPTVPTAKPGIPQPFRPGINWARLLGMIGLVRAANTIAPNLAEPTSDDYTQDERRRMRLMSTWNFGNPAVADETNRLASNASELNGVTYPDTVPVLYLLSTDSVSTIPGWAKRHEDQLGNVRRHKIVVLDGGHYLHWTQSQEMAALITDFIGRK